MRNEFVHVNANYIHTDELLININGKNHELHNYSNDTYTLQYVHASSSQEAMEEHGFLLNYVGTLIHDHNKVQYNFGTKHAEYKDNRLLFMYDFNKEGRLISDQQNEKLNIEIFRSEAGAKYYLQIRSFISTFLKNNRNVFEGIIVAFDDRVITLK